MLSSLSKMWLAIKRNSFLILTSFCIVLGISLGIVMQVFGANELTKIYVGLPGELFLRVLNFAVIPLLACNIIAVSSQLKPLAHGKTVLLVLIYCFVMNISGSYIGLGTTVLINPGGRFDGLKSKVDTSPEVVKMDIQDVLPDFLRNMFPNNILKTLLVSTVTTYVPMDIKNSSNGDGTVSYKRSVGTTDGPNILGILASSLVVGLVSGSRPEKARPIIALAEAVTEVMTVLIEFIIKLLPYAMISLIAFAVAQMENMSGGILSLSLFVATTVVFHLILIFCLMPFLYFVTLKRNLFKLYPSFGRPIITAFTATSSLISLPDLFTACDKLGVDQQLVRTIAPFLTSFNANGSAAFIASAVCFLAQISKHPLNVPQLLALGLLSGINVMALPAVPSASLITVLLLSRVFGVPESLLSYLFVVEFVADRIRTVVNVASHGTCVMFVHTYLKRVKNAEVGTLYNSVLTVEVPSEEVIYSTDFNSTKELSKLQDYDDIQAIKQPTTS